MITFNEYRQLEEAGFTKQDLQEVAIIPAVPYILSALRIGRALRKANKGIKFMRASDAMRVADDFVGPPKPYRFGDPDFIGPGPQTAVRTSKFRNFAKQINMDPDMLGDIIGGVVALLVLILAFTQRKHMARVAKYILNKFKDLIGTGKAKFKKYLDDKKTKQLEKELIKQVA